MIKMQKKIQKLLVQENYSILSQCEFSFKHEFGEFNFYSFHKNDIWIGFRSNEKDFKSFQTCSFGSFNLNDFKLLGQMIVELSQLMENLK